MDVLTEVLATQYDKNYLVEDAYDHTKWNLGKGIQYLTDGGFSYFAPSNRNIRPMEESTAFACACPNEINKNVNEDYIFFADNATAAATRRVRLYTYNHKTDALTANGFITLTLPTATNHTTRDLRIDYKKEITGTVSGSGTAITGSGTSWSTARVAVGARIGFGSTDPSQITTWYRVSAVGSDTSITLTTTLAASVTAGSAYVIEEFRPIILTTNATTTNGGVFLAKGVTPEDFIPSGTTIAAATTTDNLKAVYWLKNASTETNIVGAGMVIDTEISATSRELFVLDSPSAGNYKVYKYDVRVALASLSSGASTSAFVLATGTQAVTGTISQNSNLALATAGHGAGNGVKSLYFVTTTRVYRAALSNITDGNVTWQSDNIVETPPGGVNTMTAASALNSISYSETSDRFLVISTSSVSYFTQYVTSGTQFDKIFGRNFFTLDQSTADSDLPIFYTPNATALTASALSNNAWVICKNGTATTNNQAYVLSLDADWDYANTTQGYLISPRITVTDAVKFLRAYQSEIRYLGQNEQTKPTEPYKVYFRTTDITADATTGWALLDLVDDLSSYSGATECQIKIIWKTIGDINLYARITGLGIHYRNKTTDSHWVFSREKSDSATKRFAFRQRVQYGASYPTLTIELFDSVSGSSLLVDDSVAQLDGVWEKSTDGTTWGSYNDTDRAAVAPGDDTYIRFTPTASLTGKIEVTLY